ncbi:NTP transferase domain-containing protein [Rhizosaccharibacter radicis]|uniref:Phosphocholine cytidylyltransferase family protein n=1 Tax=Rhizosaccharibacter radicis TaxID=2782605 RepID=A0ABT1W0K2_9PROT|nr:phosphocholine cytidylyltransferase family protein [Acetobacteraceae bacterium KSS12]
MLHAFRPPAVLILAAGRGRRLGPDAPERPKVLLPFGGRTLLDRHLHLLEEAGAGPVTIVTGFEAGQIEHELVRLGRRDEVTLLHNPHWREGSVVSLDAGRPVLDAAAEAGTSVVLMDGDVLYDRRLLDRLLSSAHPGALLLDREIEPGDEPVKICVRDRRDADPVIVDFDKRPDGAPGEGYDWHGESVGFFRLSAAIASALALRAHALAQGDGRALEYETPLRALIREDAARAAAGGAASFGFEDISGLPWTEIDFVEDLRKAEALLPLLQGERAA